ncbi:MAG: hypothetical protein J5486_03710 [Bacteroidaceae bacterium]|nr:hypothetical protein [Bacteroidaceae bacterium]
MDKLNHHSSFVIRHSSWVFIFLLLSFPLRAEVVLPYGVGYNMEVGSDSLCLQLERPMHWSEGAVATSDSIWLYDKALLVVADITVIPEDTIDSVWVKVAANQFVMGWTHQSELLSKAHPDNPISAAMYAFSWNHSEWAAKVCVAFALLAALFVVATLLTRRQLQLPHFHDIPSLYPPLLIVATIALALLSNYFYDHQHQQWVAFYFYPSLNPLSVLRPLRWLILAWWCLPLLLIATVYDVAQVLRPVAAVTYLLVLLGWCMLLFELIINAGNSVLCLTLSGFYALYVVFTYCLLRHPRYVCGTCHSRLHSKGICPQCGAMNV